VDFVGRLYSLSRIYLYIFNWKKVSTNSLELYKKIAPIIQNTVIINCDESLILDSGIQHIQLDDSHYYGSQYNHAIKHVDSTSIMCVIVGDNISDNNFDMIFRNAIHAFNTYTTGVFAPNDKRSYHNKKIRTIKDSLYVVENTDCGFWFLHPTLVAKLRNIEYSKCTYGWGIDIITMKESMKQNLLIIQDYSIETDQIDHSTGYSISDAKENITLLESLYNDVQRQS
jgi:hypothetical protein